MVDALHYQRKTLHCVAYYILFLLAMLLCVAMLLCSAELHSSPRDAPLPGLGTALCILHITLLRVLHILHSNLRPDYCVFVIALLLHVMARLKRSNYYNITVLYGCVLRSCVQLQHLRSALWPCYWWLGLMSASELPLYMFSNAGKP